ncbi:MAG TPA: hypothetical protein VFV35_06060 [Acidimicrobiales bacterium]|nr:hypothetical protein [Acidimicrobiales bacterium]
MRIAAYTPDLMDRSKISAAAAAGSHELTYVGAPEALVGLAGVDLVVVDLSKRGAAAVLPDLAGGSVRVLAFASHVDIPRIGAAAGVGVLPRSKFFGSLADLLRE